MKHLDSKEDYDAQKRLLKYFDENPPIRRFPVKAKAMTPEERREIAEWCGWRWVRAPEITPGWGKKVWMIDGSDTEAVTDDGRPWGGRFIDHPEPDDEIDDSKLPDYPNSLDACAEFEAVAVENGTCVKYQHRLTDVICDGIQEITKYDAVPTTLVGYLLMATPPQRCEAILAVIRETKA